MIILYIFSIWRQTELGDLPLQDQRARIDNCTTSNTYEYKRHGPARRSRAVSGVRFRAVSGVRGVLK